MFVHFNSGSALYAISLTLKLVSVFPNDEHGYEESTAIGSPIYRHIGDAEEDDDEGKLIKTKVRNLMSSLTLFNIILIYCFLPCAQLNAVVTAAATQPSHPCALSRARTPIQQQQQQPKTNFVCTRYRRLKRRKLD